MKIKSLLVLGLSLCIAHAVQAQTMNVKTGEVVYAHPAASTGDMTFSGGTQLTVQGKTYNISDIDQIYVDNSSVADNTVSVVYSGTTALVTVAGNIAPYLTVTADGADVSIVQGESLEEKVTYTLSGSSTDGSFYMDGEYKMALVLNNLTLTNADGAAIDIEDGKKIDVTLTGTNTLSDGSNGSHNACFFLNGHPEFSGSGSLSIAGNTKHALTADEYLTISGGNITVTSAVSDGFHVAQYFQMDGGTVNITAAGDGIDVGFRGENKGTKAQYENNGFMMLNGGTLNVTSTGAATKALKADSTILVAGATVTATTSGSAYYDSSEADISSSSAIKSGGGFTLSSGTVTATSTGAGGKGVNVDDNITISGGTLYVTTTGAVFEYGDDDTKPQGVKTDAGIYLTGGNVYVCASSDSGTAFKTDGVFSIGGATVMGIGAKKSEPTAYTQGYKTYKGVSVSAGQTVSYDGVSYTVPSIYSNSSAKILVSSPSM